MLKAIHPRYSDTLDLVINGFPLGMLSEAWSSISFVVFFGRTEQRDWKNHDYGTGDPQGQGGVP